MLQEHSGIGTYQPDIDADVLQLITQKDILACYADNSTYQEKSETDSRYFYPFEIEFCLASVGLLLSLTNSGNIIIKEMVTLLGVFSSISHFVGGRTNLYISTREDN